MESIPKQKRQKLDNVSDTENEISDTENYNSDTENDFSDTENYNSDTESDISETENDFSDTKNNFQESDNFDLISEFWKSGFLNILEKIIFSLPLKAIQTFVKINSGKNS